MVTRPNPTLVMHFTDVAHLATILAEGLLCDNSAAGGLLTNEAGNPDIKADRRHRPVKADPFGMVGDYVPFYFAARSPMMFAISHGRVPSYGTDVSGLIYLVTSTQELVAQGLRVLVTDRNAALGYAEFRPESESDDLVDWDLMKQRYWNDTDKYPDRRERRMAECLVHGKVPFAAFGAIVAQNNQQAANVEAVLSAAGTAVSVYVIPDWYI